jgi:hypothetical protein
LSREFELFKLFYETEFENLFKLLFVRSALRLLLSRFDLCKSYLRLVVGLLFCFVFKPPPSIKEDDAVGEIYLLLLEIRCLFELDLELSSLY